MIAGNQALFFDKLAQSTFEEAKECQDLSCVNARLRYKGFDYEVVVTYFNKADPEVVFGDKVLFALGQDFSYPTEKYEDVIPAILVQFTDGGGYIITEMGLSQAMAHSGHNKACIGSNNGGQCVGWQIQARFKHEWYMAVDTYKSTVMFPSIPMTHVITTPHGYIHLTGKY